MKENRLIYPIKLMSRALGVSRSGYYGWLTRKPSARAVADALLVPRIVEIHEESRKTYGSRRVKDELAARGVHAGRDRIGRIRTQEGLVCVQKRKFKATTNSRHNFPIESKLLDQDFSGHAPGEVWGTDITYIPTGEGWLYLAGVKDFSSKEIVGWAMGERMTKEKICGLRFDK
jgi:putative transposase